ncbi:MAG: BON domain-containing protein [Pyrinomonadaceae bacterium]
MSSIKLLALMGTLVLAGLCLGCDTTGNTNNANGTARNENATLANANSTPTPAAKRNGNLSREDVDKDKDSYRKQAKDLGRTVGDGAEDVWLWVKTRSALAAADDLRDSTIDVDVANNAVTLSGSVANAGQKTKAEQLAKEIEGVKSVKNNLRVAADGSPNATSDKKAPAGK